jgi:subtilase family serine protease
MAQQFASTARIVNPIDERQLTTLKGNTHPAANARNDRGPVSPDLPMTDLILVLSRSPEQQAAFDKFVASQYEPGSPDFHHWLEPEEVGSNFGPSESDIATISSWLTGHGFSIDEVSKDRMTIRFSGTAGQVESAFHTEIHNLEAKGAAHIGNMSDPQIPAALAPVVVGVKSLHNFFPKPMHKLGSKVQLNSQTGRWERIASTTGADAATSGASGRNSPRPQFGINVPAQNGYDAYTVEDVAPYDFATIYNVLPLWNATNRIDGTGQTIAIAGTSAIEMGLNGGTNDVATFRSTFGLPAYTSANQPEGISGNSQPLTICANPYTNSACSIDDLEENSLDVEWSGAVAPGAKIILVSSYPASATDDTLWDSESYIVNTTPLIAHIMSVSYGECELGLGTTGNAAYYNLWQTAVTEGISVFVAAGDSGAPSCDGGGDSIGNPYSAQYGLSVSGLASTPFTTTVGGTDLNWCNQNSSSACPAGPYWSSSNNATTGASALGYLPEVPWNDTCTNPLYLSFLQSVANGVGAPAVTNTEGACNFIQNYWETVAENENYGEVLAPLVDTIGGGGGASGCVVNGTTSTAAGSVASCAGSSVPTNLGTIDLVNDGWPKPSWQAGVSGIPSDGVRDLPDVSFFAGNGGLGSSTLICVSANGACLTQVTDVTSEPTVQEVGGTSVGTPEMAGVMALINQKTGASQGFANPGLYSLAAKQSWGSCSAERGNGQPVTTSSCYFNDIDTGTNAMPCDYGATLGGAIYDPVTGQYEPGQVYAGIVSPNCSVIASGDLVGLLVNSSGADAYNATAGFDLATGLGSLNVANVVNGWVSTAGTGTATVTVLPAETSITANQSLNVTVTVASAPAGGTTPTGTVTLSGGGLNPILTGTLSSGSYTFNIPGDGLNAGTDTLTAIYSGDSNYAIDQTGTAIVVVSKLTPNISVLPSSGTLNSNYPLTVTGTVSGSGGTPTGTVTLSGGGYTSPAQTLSGSGGYSFTIPANTFTASATITLAALYSGDATYNSGNGAANVVVTYVPVLIPTVTVTPASSSVDSNQSLSVTVTVTGLSNGETSATGTVTLSGGGYSSAVQTLSGGAYTFTIPASSFTSFGTDTLTATYSGDAYYNANTGTATVTVDESGFALGAAPPVAISSPGGSTSTYVTVTASYGYTGTATLTCALTGYTPGDIDLPTCSISSAAVPMGGAALATVNTTSASSELVWPKLGNGRGWAGAGGGAVLAFLVFLGIPARRRSWRSMLGVLVVMAALGSLAGCGGGSSTTPPSGTTPDNYTFTVTGTGTPAVTPAPTTTFTVTVN